MAFTNGPPWPTRIHSVSQARSCTRIARPAGTAPITHDGARIRTTHDYESFFLAPGSADASASHEHLSIRRTALYLHIQSSTASRRIRALEDRLGAQIARAHVWTPVTTE